MIDELLFDERRQARATDPDTSKDNASRVLTQAASRWVLAVLRLESNRSVTDQEIGDIASRMGCTLSEDRLRHGRKALEEIGWVKHNGFGMTARNKLARAWQLTDKHGNATDVLLLTSTGPSGIGGEYQREVRE